MLIQDYLDICDPVLTFDRFMGGIELEKYLKNIPQHDTGRLRYDPVSMLKTVLFGFMANGYISLRELEDQCKVNLRFMYLMDHQTPSYHTFGYFINEVLADPIEEIFQDINKKIFETEHVDTQHIYIDGSKFEANANKYSWVWKKSTEKSRYRLFDKITTLFEEINEELSCTGIKLCINSEYASEYLKEAAEQYAEAWQIKEDGAMATGWQQVGNTWYYLNGSGAMQTGWLKRGSKWYYLNGSGAMVTGWLKSKNIWYYLKESGVMTTGWQKINGKWYYMNTSGAMQTGWQKINGKWYYMNTSGAMLTGWNKIGGKWYYMNGSGAMLTGWQKIGGKWYYMNGSGVMVTGWLKLGSKWYYMNGSGVMVTGRQKIGGKWYQFNASGVWIK